MATAVLGTLVHGLVRLWQTRETGDQSGIDRVLLGRNRREAVRWLLGAVVLSLVTFGATAMVHSVRRSVGRQWSALGVGVEFVAGVAILFAVLAAVHAYRNGGLLVGWALVFGPSFAVWAVVFSLPLHPTVWGQLSSMYVPTVLSAAAAVVVGTGGFLLGVGARRLARASVAERSPA